MTNNKYDENYLHNLYSRIYSITSNLMRNFNDEALFSAIKERETIFGLINECETTVGKSKLKISGETRNVITMIMTIDETIKGKIRERLTQIKSDMNGLYTTSRAAAAYSAYLKKR